LVFSLLFYYNYIQFEYFPFPHLNNDDFLNYNIKKTFAFLKKECPAM